MRYGIGIRNNLFFMSFVIGATCYSTYTTSVAAVELSEGQELSEEQRRFTIEAHQVPTELRPIRSMQLEMAEKADIHLKISEKEGMSATGIVGVPSELRDFPVYDENAAEIVLEALYPYYGFTDSESLKLKGSRDAGGQIIYDAEQYINGYPTGRLLEVWVQKKTFTIIRFSGFLSIDKGLPTQSNIKKEEAIDLVLTAIQEDRIKDSYLANDRAELDLKGEVKTRLFYRETKISRALSLWWGVGIPLKDPSKYEGGNITHQWYRVPPSGEVELWMGT